ncbi:MAG: hypothetical protein ACTSXV_01755 [Alphaproteobacteria bacterium]
MKKIGLILILGLAGCQMNGFMNEPKSLTEKVEILDKAMRNQTGRIEVLEQKNKVLRKEVEVLKFDTESRLNVLERKSFLDDKQSFPPVIQPVVNSDAPVELIKP